MEKTRKYVISLTRGEHVDEIVENVDGKALANDVEQRIFEGDVNERTENIGTEMVGEKSEMPFLNMEIEGMENIVKILKNRPLNDDVNPGESEVTFTEETLYDIKEEV